MSVSDVHIVSIEFVSCKKISFLTFLDHGRISRCVLVRRTAMQ